MIPIPRVQMRRMSKLVVRNSVVNIWRGVGHCIRVIRILHGVTGVNGIIKVSLLQAHGDPVAIISDCTDGVVARRRTATVAHDLNISSSSIGRVVPGEDFRLVVCIIWKLQERLTSKVKIIILEPLIKATPDVRTPPYKGHFAESQMDSFKVTVYSLLMKHFFAVGLEVYHWHKFQRCIINLHQKQCLTIVAKNWGS